MKLIKTKSKNSWIDGGGIGSRTENYLGTAPNTPEAHELVKCLSVLYKPYGKLTKKGRNPNRRQFLGVDGLNRYNLKANCRIGLSTYFDVYLYRNDGKYGMKGIPDFNNLPLGIVKAWTIMKKA